MQIRFEEIYQLSLSILAPEAKDTITPALEKALKAFEESYGKGFGIKGTAKGLRAALSERKQELATSKGELSPQCAQLLAMLEFMPCFQDYFDHGKKIQQVLFDKFEKHFTYRYKTELKSICLTKEGLIFDFKSVEARDHCKTLLAYFNFHVSEFASGFTLSIPHQQVYKFFTIAFYIEYQHSETPNLIKKVKQFYTEASMDWKSACANTVAAINKKNVQTLHDHFQHYFLLLDIDTKIHVELTTLGCIFFVSNWDGEKHIETLFNHFQKQQLAVQKPKIPDVAWFQSFHSANPHLQQEFKNFFQENAYRNSQYFLIPPHHLEQLLSVTAFAPKHIVDATLVSAYVERKLDYHAVVIQYLAKQNSSATPNDNLSMVCHYAETENEVLAQWSIEPKSLVKPKQDLEKHVIILLDDTSLPGIPDKEYNLTPQQQKDVQRNKNLHNAAIATCTHIIDTLPDDVVVSLYAYQSTYPTFDQVKKSALVSHWKENIDFISAKKSDQNSFLHFGRFEKKPIPNSAIVINISKDFNVKKIPSLNITQNSYIPIIIGKADPLELPLIEPHSHFASYFIIESQERIPTALGLTIVKTLNPSIGPVLCGVVSKDSGEVVFKQPNVTFIDGFSYHAYSCIPKAYWHQQNPEKNLRLILRFEDKTIISSPKFHLITEQQDIEKLKGACSRSRIHSQFLLNDEVSFELESKKETKQPEIAPKKVVTNREAPVNPPPLFSKTPESPDLQPPSHTTPQAVSKLENVQPQKLENAQPKNPSKTIEVIKRLFSLSTAIQLTAFLILLGLVLANGYGALIITALVTLSIGLVSQLVINYLDRQNWEKNVRNNPSETYLEHELKQLVPSSLGGKCLMGLSIAASIMLFGFCMSFIMADPISVNLLAPIFNAMHHFLSNGMLDINLSGIPAEAIKIVANTMATLFLSTIPLVVMLFFKSMHDIVTSCVPTSKSTNETEDRSKNPIDHSQRIQTGDVFKPGSSNLLNVGVHPLTANLRKV